MIQATLANENVVDVCWHLCAHAQPDHHGSLTAIVDKSINSTLQQSGDLLPITAAKKHHIESLE